MAARIEQTLALQPVWLQDWGYPALSAAAAVLVALGVHWLGFRVLSRFARRTASEADNILLQGIRSPTRYALIALALVLAAREWPGLEEIWERVAGFVMPALIGWIALAIMRALVKAASLKADITVADNLRARRKRTKLTMFSRIATFVILFVTIGLMLLSVPGIRDIGLTLMASAGLAGLAVGAAAQPALKSLIAGVQMALTEPINIDDVVEIEGELGRIEDIRTTYVVVRIWDERRLIVPTSRFLEGSFENWTKNAAQLVGHVMLYLDPTAKIGPIRTEFERQIEANPRWDDRVKAAQVTEARSDSIELRLLMSAQDSATLFDLRCDIREGMLEWLTDNQPGAFPRSRFTAAEPVEVIGRRDEAA